MPEPNAAKPSRSRRVGDALQPFFARLPAERPASRRCERCGQMIEPVELPNPLRPGEVRWVLPARCRCEVAEWERGHADLRDGQGPDASAHLLQYVHREGDVEVARLPAGGLVGPGTAGKSGRALPGEKLGPRFRGALLGNFESAPGTETAVARVRDYLDQWAAAPRVEHGDGRVEGVTHGLYFVSGQAGAGKTRLAATLANELYVRHGVRAEVWIVPELFEEARRRIDSGQMDAFLDGVRNARHLLLDDLGTQKLTDWGYEQLFVLVDHRYRRCLPTHVTSNFLPAELETMDLGRVASRLAGMTRSVPFKGAGDYRKLEARAVRGN